ncbi:hypothetical protein NL108_008884 [Boleophthalmus pectinirostris]|nr:hypothetical protein NL108_008884 [Boleophthalmus pectinirostris]
MLFQSPISPVISVCICWKQHTEQKKTVHIQSTSINHSITISLDLFVNTVRKYIHTSMFLHLMQDLVYSILIRDSHISLSPDSSFSSSTETPSCSQDMKKTTLWLTKTRGPFYSHTFEIPS